jgi:TonB-dependent Receptor Plug Domain
MPSLSLRSLPAALLLSLLALSPPAGAQVPYSSPTQLDAMVVYGRENNLIGDADSPSEGEVGSAELDARPFLRRGELLESIPGMIVTQHSGDGKANQYFLRGFNLDHGTDFATTVDGMPVNLPSNAHGQGYSDLNFIIPEVVQSITYQKGTYDLANGDFSAAGAAQFHLADSLPQGLVKVEFEPDESYYRIVAADSVPTAGGGAILAAEYGYDNGPWVNPEDADHVSIYGRRFWAFGDNEFTLTLIAYHAAWNSTDQVPERAIDEGLISRFGAIDPTDGGTTTRANLDFNWVHSGPDSTTRLNAYALYYRLSLYSDFTYFLVDPVHGDQFAQRDRRGVFGSSGSHEWTSKTTGRDVKTTLGFDDRSDVIALGLLHTEDRGVISPVDLSSVHEYEGGIYAESEATISDWFKVNGGIRADGARFLVDDSIAANSGGKAAAILSPKLNLVFGPWDKTEFYIDAGDGFHSNDARGTVEHINPADGSPASPVTPLVRAEGVEVGARTSLLPGLVSTVSAWGLDLGSELTFDGDTGETDPSGATRRYGVEFANFYHLTPLIALDADVSFTHARYRQETNGGVYIANSIGTVLTGGVTFNPGSGFFASMRGRYFGPQPIVETGEFYEPSSLTFNGRVGWRSRDWELSVDLLNLLDRRNDDIAYYYTSRLQGEPAAGISGVQIHPAEPRTVRFSILRRF